MTKGSEASDGRRVPMSETDAARMRTPASGAAKNNLTSQSQRPGEELVPSLQADGDARSPARRPARQTFVPTMQDPAGTDMSPAAHAADVDPSARAATAVEIIVEPGQPAKPRQEISSAELARQAEELPRVLGRIPPPNSVGHNDMTPLKAEDGIITIGYEPYTRAFEVTKLDDEIADAREIYRSTSRRVIDAARERHPELERVFAPYNGPETTGLDATHTVAMDILPIGTPAQVNALYNNQYARAFFVTGKLETGGYSSTGLNHEIGWMGAALQWDIEDIQGGTIQSVTYLDNQGNALEGDAISPGGIRIDYTTAEGKKRIHEQYSCTYATMPEHLKAQLNQEFDGLFLRATEDLLMDETELRAYAAGVKPDGVIVSDMRSVIGDTLGSTVSEQKMLQLLPGQNYGYSRSEYSTGGDMVTILTVAGETEAAREPGQLAETKNRQAEVISSAGTLEGAKAQAKIIRNLFSGEGLAPIDTDSPLEREYKTVIAEHSTKAREEISNLMGLSSEEITPSGEGQEIELGPEAKEKVINYFLDIFKLKELAQQHDDMSLRNLELSSFIRRHMTALQAETSIHLVGPVIQFRFQAEQAYTLFNLVAAGGKSKGAMFPLPLPQTHPEERTKFSNDVYINFVPADAQTEIMEGQNVHNHELWHAADYFREVFVRRARGEGNHKGGFSRPERLHEVEIDSKFKDRLNSYFFDPKMFAEQLRQLKTLTPELYNFFIRVDPNATKPIDGKESQQVNAAVFDFEKSFFSIQDELPAYIAGFLNGSNEPINDERRQVIIDKIISGYMPFGSIQIRDLQWAATQNESGKWIVNEDKIERIFNPIIASIGEPDPAWVAICARYSDKDPIWSYKRTNIDREAYSRDLQSMIDFLLNEGGTGHDALERVKTNIGRSIDAYKQLATQREDPYVALVELSLLPVSNWELYATRQTEHPAQEAEIFDRADHAASQSESQPIPTYHAVERMPKGSQHVVYKVMVDGVPRALKTSPNSVEEEYNLLTGIEHPHILPALEHKKVKIDTSALENGSTDLAEVNAILLPFVPDTLHTKLPQLTQQQIGIILHQQFEAMEYLHSVRVFQHDIKLTNILVNEDGSESYLTDFNMGIKLERWESAAYFERADYKRFMIMLQAIGKAKGIEIFSNIDDNDINRANLKSLKRFLTKFENPDAIIEEDDDEAEPTREPQAIFIEQDSPSDNQWL